MLFDKRTIFKENKKVRKADRWLQLPFSSFNFNIFIISSLCVVGGLASIFGDKNTSTGLPMLLVGLFLIVLVAIFIENPKIWFSNSNNLEDDIAKINISTR
jgi:hypothetical protein